MQLSERQVYWVHVVTLTALAAALLFGLPDAGGPRARSAARPAATR